MVLVNATGRILAASPNDAVAGELGRDGLRRGPDAQALVLLPEGLHLISIDLRPERPGQPALVVADRVGWTCCAVPPGARTTPSFSSQRETAS